MSKSEENTSQGNLKEDVDTITTKDDVQQITSSTPPLPPARESRSAHRARIRDEEMQENKNRARAGYGLAESATVAAMEVAAAGTNCDPLASSTLAKNRAKKDIPTSPSPLPGAYRVQGPSLETSTATIFSSARDIISSVAAYVHADPVPFIQNSPQTEVKSNRKFFTALTIIIVLVVVGGATGVIISNNSSSSPLNPPPETVAFPPTPSTPITTTILSNNPSLVLTGRTTQSPTVAIITQSVTPEPPTPSPTVVTTRPSSPPVTTRPSSPPTAPGPTRLPTFFICEKCTLVEQEGNNNAVIPAYITFKTAVVDEWEVNGDYNDSEAAENAGKVEVLESGNLFQTLLGTAEWDLFGGCVALSADIHTLLVGASYVDNMRGVVVVHHRSTTVDQFTLKHTLFGKKEFDYFGWTFAMTPNSMAVAVTAGGTDFNGNGSGSVYFYMRYTSNDEFFLVNRVDGGCKDENLGNDGVAFEASDDALLIHVKAYNGDCIINANKIRTYRLQ